MRQIAWGCHGREVDRFGSMLDSSQLLEATIYQTTRHFLGFSVLKPRRLIGGSSRGRMIS